MAAEFTVEVGDVTQVASDLLILKYAQGFHGADEDAARILSDRGVVKLDDLRSEPGDVKIIETHGVLAPTRVMFVGVARLGQFRYPQMRNFARLAIKTASEIRAPIQQITTTVHGPGYGLDLEESMQALVFGYQLGLAQHHLPKLTRITFVDMHPRRAAALENTLRSMGSMQMFVAPEAPATAPPKPPAPPEKKTVFVAMPFSEDFEDVYEFGIYAPVRRCGYVCERVDELAFAGDLVGRIQEGIRASSLVVADLTLERPNVYLEVGFAWGLGKPVLLLAREGQRLHFDLSHHKCIFYRTIGKLAVDLERVIRELFGAGTEMDRPS
jgi:hypothetical protein